MAKIKCVENIKEVTKKSGVGKVQLLIAMLLTVRGRQT
jgi:hypothetical protein